MSLYQNFLKEFNKTVQSSKRDISEIELIAVSKKKSADDIKQVCLEKHLSYGENQIQEIEKKWSDLKVSFPDTRLHFIGGIQSRKVSSIYHQCDVIHSIDRLKIVKLFNELELSHGVVKEYFIQINTGDEPQKSGVTLAESEKFISNCLNSYNLSIKGLMCIPPFDENPKKHFLTLADLAKNFNLKSLSMGMSNDYKIALECGATHIRIGTKIFGERN